MTAMPAQAWTMLPTAFTGHSVSLAPPLTVPGTSAGGPWGAGLLCTSGMTRSISHSFHFVLFRLL